MHSSAFSGVRCIELAALKQLRPRPYTRTQFLRKGFCLALKGPNRFLTEHHREKQFKPQHEKRGRFCTSLARGRSSPGPPHKHRVTIPTAVRFSPLCILDPHDGTAGGLARRSTECPVLASTRVGSSRHRCDLYPNLPDVDRGTCMHLEPCPRRGLAQHACEPRAWRQRQHMDHAGTSRRYAR